MGIADGLDPSMRKVASKYLSEPEDHV
jgi:hypothetical protein